MDDRVGTMHINIFSGFVKDDHNKTKQNNFGKWFNSVPTTPTKRLGLVSRDNIVEEIIRVVLCIIKSNEKIILI